MKSSHYTRDVIVTLCICLSIILVALIIAGKWIFIPRIQSIPISDCSLNEIKIGQTYDVLGQKYVLEEFERYDNTKDIILEFGPTSSEVVK